MTSNNNITDSNFELNYYTDAERERLGGKLGRVLQIFVDMFAILD